MHFREPNTEAVKGESSSSCSCNIVHKAAMAYGFLSLNTGIYSEKQEEFENCPLLKRFLKNYNYLLKHIFVELVIKLKIYILNKKIFLKN